MGRCWECLPIPLEAGRLILRRTYTYIIESRLQISLGRVADRERKHPGEEASGHQGALGEKASEVRAIRAPGGIRRGGIQGKRCPGTWAESRPGVSGPIHCPRSAGLELGPIGALELGRLARGTELGPMVPTVSCY